MLNTKGYSEHVPDSISWMLFYDLNRMYESVLDEILDLKNPGYRVGINGITPRAISSFPLAVATWEAYLHEVLLNPQIQKENKGNIIWEMSETIDKWDVKTKTFMIPKFLLKKTFDKSKAPFQNFEKLVKVRNSIVHYKMDKPPKDVIAYFEKNKIVIERTGYKQRHWTNKITTSESIRWSINVIAEMVKTLNLLFPAEEKPMLSQVFSIIDNKEVYKIFKDRNVDPKSNFIPKIK